MIQPPSSLKASELRQEVLRVRPKTELQVGLAWWEEEPGRGWDHRQSRHQPSESRSARAVKGSSRVSRTVKEYLAELDKARTELRAGALLGVTVRKTVVSRRSKPWYGLSPLRNTAGKHRASVAGVIALPARCGQGCGGWALRIITYTGPNLRLDRAFSPERTALRGNGHPLIKAFVAAVSTESAANK
jgi:hypothetical protein